MEPDTRQTHPLPKAGVAKFEDVYPQYAFAPLVHLALTAAQWMKRHSHKKPQVMRPDETRPAAGFKPAVR
jgi:hypothetical protein